MKVINMETGVLWVRSEEMYLELFPYIESLSPKFP